MKTKESRFQVHDELTAPERSLPVLKGALAAGGQLSNFIGVLAGSPADFGTLIGEQTDRWATVIRTANIKPD